MAILSKEWFYKWNIRSIQKGRSYKIKLTGEISNYYDVYYRVHAQDLGWMSWTCNDSKAGTEGLELRVEAIQICLVEKVKMRLEIFLDLLLNKEKSGI